MARTRSIKPGFFSNEQLADLDPLARILFAGLWTIADREGRLLDRPRKIKVATLPYDDCDIDAFLDQLQSHGFITRYIAGSGPAIQVHNWSRHQNPHHKEPPSEIQPPSINGHAKSTRQVRGKSEASTRQAPDKYGTGLGPAPDKSETNTGRAQVEPCRNPEPGNSNRNRDEPPFPPSGGQPDRLPWEDDVEAPADSPLADGATKPRRRKARTPAPEIRPTPEMYAWAREHCGFDERTVNRETLKMLDHHRAKGSLMADWIAAWRTWMRNAVDFNRPREIRPKHYTHPAQQPMDMEKRRRAQAIADAEREQRYAESLANGTAP